MRPARLAVPAYSLILAIVVTAPLWRPGYLLVRDAVSTPRSYLSDAALGLTEAAPRALPQDFLVVLASHVFDGGVVVKALLVAGLWLAGWGAARLAGAVLPAAGQPGQFVAATVAVWNPYVAERLLQGHWSLLVGYGCLPWVALAMLGLRTDGTRSAWFALAFWMALAGVTPTGLILAATVALVAIAVPGAGTSRWRCGAAGLVLALLSAAPWLIAAALTDSLAAYRAGGAAGVAAFAARAEPGLGTLGSLAGLGGIWNADAVPATRSTLFAAVATLVLLAVVGLGAVAAVRNRTGLPFLVLAVVAVALPAAMATGPGMALLRTLAEAAPGLGVLRDGQKWVALALPGYAVAAAGSVVTLSRWRPALSPAAVAATCCAVLIAALPDLAWGAWGKVTAVRYPSGWAQVAERINADPGPVAVLPADSMRQFGWAGAAPVLDPLPRWLRADVLSTGDLNISGGTVFGEGNHARAVQELLLAGASPARLADAGVRWVVVESHAGGETGSATATLAELPRAYSDADLTLYRVGGTAPPASRAHRAASIGAHLVWLAVLVVGAAGMAVRRVRD